MDGVREPRAQLHAKRARVQLSCSHCRHAKLKCDRAQPCNQCVKRDRAEQCAFAPPPARRKPAKKMQDRLRHLEGLVKSLASQTSQSMGNEALHETVESGSPRTSATNLGSSINPDPHIGQPRRCPRTGDTIVAGQILVGKNETTFVGATHWAAILDDIEEVKMYFDDEEVEEDPDESYALTSTLILGMGANTTKADLIASLPKRMVVDKLITRYFRSNDPGLHLIHRPTFQKEYQEFWADSKSKPIIWVGLLYAIMCLSTCFCFCSSEEPLEIRGTPDELINLYKASCAQCLALSNYTKPGLYTLETFILHNQSEIIQYGLMHSGAWIMHGVSIRLALKMGYHRDARNHPNLSTLEGEMRRRIWSFISQIDLLISFHLGLPSMVRAVQSDTALPHNLLDEDFSWDTQDLPPERPSSQPTEMSYIIAKARLITVFGDIAHQANAITPPTYAEVIKLDKALDAAYEMVPAYLIIRPLDEVFMDAPELIMQRFNIALLLNKSRCVLHRQHLLKEDSATRLSILNTRCTDAAMAILQYQATIFEALLPGGSLSKHQWYIHTLASHDFLLAAMILYLSLTYDKTRKPATENSKRGLDLDPNIKQTMVIALQTSYNVWQKTYSETSKKSSQVVAGMLAKLGLAEKPPSSDDIRENVIEHHDTHTHLLYPQTKHSVSEPLLLTSHQISAYPQDTMMNEMLDISRQTNDFFDFPIEVDWGMWDTQINAGSSSEPSPDVVWQTSISSNTATPNLKMGIYDQSSVHHSGLAVIAPGMQSLYLDRGC